MKKYSDLIVCAVIVILIGMAMIFLNKYDGFKAFEHKVLVNNCLGLACGVSVINGLLKFSKEINEK